MQTDLFGKVAIVTGGASGIGLAAVNILHSNGAKVVISDVNVTAAQAAADKLPGSTWRQLNVASEENVESAIAGVMSDFGRIDIVVNNAGINSSCHRVTTDRFPIEQWDMVMAVNLRGVFLVSRFAAAAMMGNGGRIINIASVTGLVPVRLQCAYNAAKAGIINLTRSMAIELAENGISVNCVAPGSTLTAMTEKIFYGTKAGMSEQAQRLIDHIPAGRVGTVDDIAAAILFFAANETAYVTGQVLSVDGGWTAGGYLRDF